MIPTDVGAEVTVPVGDGEMGALVAMGVVGEAVPCDSNSKGSTVVKNKLNGNNGSIDCCLPVHMHSIFLVG